MKIQVLLLSEEGETFTVSFCADESVHQFIELTEKDINEMCKEIKSQTRSFIQALREVSGGADVENKSLSKDGGQLNEKTIPLREDLGLSREPDQKPKKRRRQKQNVPNEKLP